jgi:hypothetical protein
MPDRRFAVGHQISEALPAAVFTEAERDLLDRSTPKLTRAPSRDLAFYVRAVARLGGYLDRASDPPPGTTVIWRGMSRLADLVEGARISRPLLGTCGKSKPLRMATNEDHRHGNFRFGEERLVDGAIMRAVFDALRGR